MTKLLIVTNSKNSISKSNGSGKRLNTLVSIIEQIGFSYVICEKNIESEFIFSHSDYIVIHSFANARKVPKKFKSKVIWLDAMDSWRLNRKILFRYLDLLSPIKLLIDYYYLNRFTNLPIVTYISKRDSHIQRKWNQRQNNILILKNSFEKIPKFSNKKDSNVIFRFVGDYNYPPNKFAAKWLKKFVKREKITNFELVGMNFPMKFEKYFKIRENLASKDLYSQNTIHVIPPIKNSGELNKIWEPFLNGCLIICWFKCVPTELVGHDNIITYKNRFELKSILDNSKNIQNRIAECTQKVVDEDNYLNERKYVLDKLRTFLIRNVYF